MDNLSESEEKRRKLILQIQELYRGGMPIRKLANILSISRHTARKYIDGNPNILCTTRKSSSLNAYDALIIKSIQDGHTASYIAKQLKTNGYGGTVSNARQYTAKLAKRYGLQLSKFHRVEYNNTQNPQEKTSIEYISRKGIFNHLWMDIELTAGHRRYLWEKYPILWELESCIREFRALFSKRSMPGLYLFINRYSSSKIKELASFAKGLQKDISAVENAVASPLSNGFVEGTNSKVKTIKKTMYGRCGITLLSAKLMYNNARK